MSQKVLVIVHQCFHSSSVELSLVTSYYWGGGMLFSVTRQLARASVCFFVFFFFPRSSFFEKHNRKINAVFIRHYMENSKT